MIRDERDEARVPPGNSTPPQAAGAEPLRLSPELDTGAAFEAIGRVCLQQIAENEPGLRRNDAEGLHQMRVGLRRLRAAISIFKDLLNDNQTDAIKAELKWITEQLGPARDYDVFAGDLAAALAGERAHADALRELRAMLVDRRAQAFNDAKLAVASERYHRALAATERWLTSGTWARDGSARQQARRSGRVLPFARKALGQRAKKLTKKLRRLGELDVDQRHRLRIQVKKLHYGSQFFASLFLPAKGRQKRFTKQLKKLQDTLGSLNDISVHARFLSDLLHREPALESVERRTRAAFALGLVLQGEQAEIGPLTAAALARGSRLAKLPQFWR
jgi:CHAD domain-containing protein